MCRSGSLDVVVTAYDKTMPASKRCSIYYMCRCLTKNTGRKVPYPYSLISHF